MTGECIVKSSNVVSATIQNCRSLANSIWSDIESGAGVDLNCSGIEQADITFVQTLLAASRSCAARDLPFTLTSMSDVVASAFHRAGVTPPGTVPSELSGI